MLVIILLRNRDLDSLLHEAGRHNYTVDTAHRPVGMDGQFIHPVRDFEIALAVSEGFENITDSTVRCDMIGGAGGQLGDAKLKLKMIDGREILGRCRLPYSNQFGSFAQLGTCPRDDLVLIRSPVVCTV
jgi:hypothetical protein